MKRVKWSQFEKKVQEGAWEVDAWSPSTWEEDGKLVTEVLVTIWKKDWTKTRQTMEVVGVPAEHAK